tara:strand:- start:10 stop:546 length:537 start_codon:yes stop_codon:yes gene_type:complete
MWLQANEVQDATHDEKWLAQYREISREEWKPSTIKVVQGVPLLLCDTNYLDFQFSNIEDCICDNYFSLMHDLVPVEGLAQWGKLAEGGYEIIMTYGTTDAYEDEGCCVKYLLQQYPELDAYARSSKGKFALSIGLVSGDFRFHKNGGYRGKDDVGEHVYDSPAKEYLAFTVVKIKENR